MQSSSQIAKYCSSCYVYCSSWYVFSYQWSHTDTDANKNRMFSWACYLVDSKTKLVPLHVLIEHHLLYVIIPSPSSCALCLAPLTPFGSSNACHLKSPASPMPPSNVTCLLNTDMSYHPCPCQRQCHRLSEEGLGVHVPWSITQRKSLWSLVDFYWWHYMRAICCSVKSQVTYLCLWITTTTWNTQVLLL